MTLLYISLKAMLVVVIFAFSFIASLIQNHWQINPNTTMLIYSFNYVTRMNHVANYNYSIKKYLTLLYLRSYVLRI